METTLFDEQDMGQRPDPAERRAVRRQVLGWVMRSIRLRSGWDVNGAAGRAGVAPMTWRRLEQGLEVRRRSLTAADGVLGVPFGTVARALDDDLLMTELADHGGARITLGCEVSEFLDGLAERARSGSTAAPAAPRPWPAVDEATNRALAAVAHHVPAVGPTDLQVVNRLIEQLTRSAVQSPAVRDLIGAAARAVPDLIAAELHEAERDITDEGVNR